MTETSILEWLQNTEGGFYTATYGDKLPSVQVPLATLMSDIQKLPYFPEHDIRYLVSTFSVDEVHTLSLAPQLLKTMWTSLEEPLTRINPRVALLMVPVFWQLGPMFYETCRAHRVPVSVLTPRNIPLAIQLIKEVGGEMMVTTPDVARELHEALRTAGMENVIKVWHLVVRLGKDIDIPELSGEVYVEQHIIPGIPLFVRAREDAGARLVSGFSLSLGTRTLVQSTERHATPFYNVELPVRIDEISKGVYVVRV